MCIHCDSSWQRPLFASASLSAGAHLQITSLQVNTDTSATDLAANAGADPPSPPGGQSLPVFACVSLPDAFVSNRTTGKEFFLFCFFKGSDVNRPADRRLTHLLDCNMCRPRPCLYLLFKHRLPIRAFLTYRKEKKGGGEAVQRKASAADLVFCGFL